MSDKILVTRSSIPPLEEYIEEIRPLWESRWLTNAGVKHQELESRLCDFFGVSNVALCCNGHLALELILEAFDLHGEVITTPFTFASTTNAIARTGLTPVFCDIDPVTFTMDPDKIEALITDKTCAIMPVHVYGNLCDDAAIGKIADKHGLKVIYDAAHAFGVKKDGVSAMRMGDASMLSFHATKVFHTIEGGAAIFRDPEVYAQFNRCKSFGILSPDELGFCGGNAKMNEFSAAMGLCNLRHIEASIASRKIAAEQYRKRLENIPGLQLSAVQEGVESNYAYFPVVFHPEKFGADRNQAMAALAEEGISARKYFYPLTSQQNCFQGRYPAEQTPIAAEIANRVLCLPLYEGLSVQDVDRICNVILKTGRE